MVVIAILYAHVSIAFAPVHEKPPEPAYRIEEHQGDYIYPQPLSKKEVSVSLCNCYLGVKEKYPALPTVAVIKAHTTNALAQVAVFNYHGVDHFAIVESVGMGNFTISETNYNHCRAGSRTISFSDPSLVGFYAIE